MASKKIIAFAGSNSSKSINRKLVSFALTQFPNDEITFLDLNDFEMPIFSVDREEKNGFPKETGIFRQYFKEADGIICSMAEHNRSYTVAFKNLLDWCSRVDLNIFANKPMLLMSTSTGGFAAGNVMAMAKSFFPRAGANIIDTFSLPTFDQNFIDGTIVNEELKKELLGKIELFKQKI